MTMLSLFKRLELFPRNCAKAHAITRTHDGRRIFGRIEKLQRSAANQIPPARRTQRINSRLRTADANRTGRNFLSRSVSAVGRPFFWPPPPKKKKKKKTHAPPSRFTVPLEKHHPPSPKFLPFPPPF